MKKLFCMLFAVVFGVMFAFAESKTGSVAQSVKEGSDAVQAIAEGVTAVHQDISNITSTVYEDGKSLIGTVYEDGKTLLVNAYPEVKEAVIKIAQSLGVAAEHVYTVLVKKYIVDGVTQLALCIVGLIFLIIGWVKFDKYVAKSERIDWHVLYPGVVLTVGIVLLLNVNYHTMFMGLINPEYGAINYILEFAKSMVK